MIDREVIIKKYFDMWLCKDCTGIEEVLSNGIVYSECYGPEYRGINQIIQWFNDWNKQGTVLQWKIKQFIHQNNQAVVEWYFECNYDKKISGFDGVSIIEFDSENKIRSLKEFQSEAKHTFPYGKI